MKFIVVTVLPKTLKMCHDDSCCKWFQLLLHTSP